MTPERWADVERLCHAALSRPADERAAFLADACAGDLVLRQEVDSLLDQESGVDGFLSSPAVVLARGMIDSGVSPIGRNVGAYVITSQLGAGGMGEVYRARDTRLGRDVAIKILPRVFTNDPERLERFEREARMLAALNHPNIGAIYGVEQLDGFPVLVLELVEGLTLAERLASGPLPVSETLSLAAQIVEALDAAHRRGIIHRDLKPTNIKITPLGNAKVLDFGLAKDLGANPETPSRTAASTPTPDRASAPGRVLGTVDYMSPEQARGEPLDPRTDLFSFGIILYEMVTAHPASAGVIAWPIIDAIRHETLPPPRRVNPDVTPKFEQIILRLLATDLDPRYQTASDVKLDLERLERAIDSARQAKDLAPVRRRRGVATVAVVAVAIGFLARAWPRIAARPAPALSEYTQVTDFADSATSPSLSPDGRLLTFIRGESTFEGLGQIYLKALPDGDPVPLTHDRLDKMSPVFSRDGGRIAYTTVNGRFGWDTWVVSVIDREPRRWLVNASGLSWIDRSRVMFSTITNDLHMSVVTADENQGCPRRPMSIRRRATSAAWRTAPRCRPMGGGCSSWKWKRLCGSNADWCRRTGCRRAGVSGRMGSVRPPPGRRMESGCISRRTPAAPSISGGSVSPTARRSRSPEDLPRRKASR